MNPAAESIAGITRGVSGVLAEKSARTVRQTWGTETGNPVFVNAPANPSGIIPLDHRVLVLHDPVDEKIGSIILPDAERDKKKFAQVNATVIAVGALAWAEAKHDAKTFAIDARFPQAGDRVKVGKYTGDQHKGDDGVEYTILNDTDVIGLLTGG